MMKLLILLLYGCACSFLAMGLLLPIIRFERLYFFSDSPSLVELVAGLWGEGDVGLAILVATFSIAFPVAKLIALGMEIGAGDRPSSLLARAMPHLSRWSMMDVMLVAIVVFAAKSSGLAQAVTQPGLWFYAASTLVTGILPMVIARLRR